MLLRRSSDLMDFVSFGSNSKIFGILHPLNFDFYPTFTTWAALQNFSVMPAFRVSAGASPTVECNGSPF